MNTVRRKGSVKIKSAPKSKVTAMSTGKSNTSVLKRAEPVLTAAAARRIAKLNSDEWIHVLPRDNSWVVRKSGAQKAVGVFSTKRTALTTAKRIKHNTATARIIIYDAYGQVLQILR